jgi:uncharacterized protein YneF (UPF0154 family)
MIEIIKTIYCIYIHLLLGYFILEKLTDKGGEKNDKYN